MIYYVNERTPPIMPIEYVSEDNNLAMVKDMQNLKPQYKMPLKRRFKITSYMFKRFNSATSRANKRPKGPHIVHLSTMCHLFDGLARAAILFFRLAQKTQIW